MNATLSTAIFLYSFICSRAKNLIMREREKELTSWPEQIKRIKEIYWRWPQACSHISARVRATYNS